MVLCILPAIRLLLFPYTTLFRSHWRNWLKPENRCLVPANSFAEFAPERNPDTGKKDVVWFARNEARPLFAFAGVRSEEHTSELQSHVKIVCRLLLEK